MVDDLIALDRDGPSLVSALTTAYLSPSAQVAVLGGSFSFCLAKTSPKNSQSCLTVQMLTSATVYPDLNSRRKVLEEDASIGLVPMLAPLAASSRERLFQVPRVDVEVMLGGFLEHGDRDGRCLNSTAFLCWRHTLESVPPRFVPEVFDDLRPRDAQQQEPRTCL